jgi:DNA processing protein
MSAAYALALTRLDGLGRVSAHRLLEHFPSVEALREAPTEAVLVRLKGVPRAADLVKRLRETEQLDDALARTRAEVAALEAKRMHVLAPSDDRWPARLNDLDRSVRPIALYAFGAVERLEEAAVAFWARSPMATEPFERAQDEARRAVEAGDVLVAGARDGFDVVIHKLAYLAKRPSVAVASAGLGRLPGPVRPHATSVVRAGGLVVSPFPMTHGPFEHDQVDAAFVAGALARAIIGAGEPDSPAARALAWAAEHDRYALDLGAATD